jgi:hypothetical protein
MHITGPILHANLWLVTALWLYDYGPPSKQSWSYAQWFLLLCIPEAASGWQVITTYAYMKQAVTSWMQTIDTIFFHIGITELLPGERCLNVSGGHKQVYVYHQLPICHVYIEVKTRFSALEFYLLQLLWNSFVEVMVKIRDNALHCCYSQCGFALHTGAVWYFSRSMSTFAAE